MEKCTNNCKKCNRKKFLLPIGGNMICDHKMEDQNIVDALRLIMGKDMLYNKTQDKKDNE